LKQTSRLVSPISKKCHSEKISKFGLSEQRNDDDSYHRWNGTIRNYMYENALCRVATDFTARLCKIRRVALLVDDNDVVNKRFVQQSMQILKDWQDEIEKKITSLQNIRQIMLKYVQENIQTFKDQLNLFETKMTTIQNSIQLKTTHRTE